MHTLSCLIFFFLVIIIRKLKIALKSEKVRNRRRLLLQHKPSQPSSPSYRAFRLWEHSDGCEMGCAEPHDNSISKR